MITLPITAGSLTASAAFHTIAPFACGGNEPAKLLKITALRPAIREWQVGQDI